MFHKDISKFPTVNISKRNFLLVICIAKNIIWTTLKAIFSLSHINVTANVTYVECGSIQ